MTTESRRRQRHQCAAPATTDRPHRIACYTGFVLQTISKANITLRLDADVIREARVLAAQQGTSVSRLLAERLEELVRGHKAYDAAHRRAVARMRAAKPLGWRKPASRAELHER
jgi:hypothetical protein